MAPLVTGEFAVSHDINRQDPMKSAENQEPDAFAHSTIYLTIRRFVRKNTPFLIRPWTVFKRAVWLIRFRSPESRFNQIHKTNYWANGESLSGEGSTLEATSSLRAALESFVREHQVRNFLDVPCGDFNWMNHVDLGIPYTGGDIVEDIVVRNQKEYANNQRKFQLIDLTRSELPACDLVFSRDCLNHLSIPDIHQAIANICSSGAIYLAVTQFPAQTVNRAQASGFTYRELNFSLAPFYWLPPVAIYDEQFHPGKHLGIWKISDLPHGKLK